MVRRQPQSSRLLDGQISYQRQGLMVPLLVLLSAASVLSMESAECNELSGVVAIFFLIIAHGGGYVIGCGCSNIYMCTLLK